MVVEEVKGLVNGDAGQPESQLRELYRQHIAIDTVDAGLDHAAAPVGCLRLFLRHTGRDRNATIGDDVFAGTPRVARGHYLLCLPPRGWVPHDLLSEPLCSSDQEVAATHGGVDDLQLEHGIGEGVIAPLLRTAVCTGSVRSISSISG